MSEVFVQRLEDGTMQESVATNLALVTTKRYVDNSHTRFETVHWSHSFLNILHKQNSNAIHNGKGRTIINET